MSKLAIVAGVLIAGLVFGNPNHDTTNKPDPGARPAVHQEDPKRELFVNFEPFPEERAFEEGVTVVSCEGCDENPYYGHSMRLLVPGAALTAKTTLPDHKVAVLQLRHLSSYDESCPNNGYSPITVSVNGNAVAEHYAPADHNYMVDRWIITPFTREGENAIVITADSDQCTHYWVNRMSVFY